MLLASTHKAVNQRSKHVTQVQKQRPGSPTVTLTWHSCKDKVHKFHQSLLLACLRLRYFCSFRRLIIYLSVNLCVSLVPFCCCCCDLYIYYHRISIIIIIFSSSVCVLVLACGCFCVRFQLLFILLLQPICCCCRHYCCCLSASS